MKVYEFKYRLLRKFYFPTIPVLLKGVERWIPADALLDSGAIVSLFQGDIGRELGLEITKGKRFIRGELGATSVHMFTACF